MRAHLIFWSVHPVAFHGDWFWHKVISALIYSAIYGVMYHVFRGLGLFGSILAGVAILAASWLIYLFLIRS